MHLGLSVSSLSTWTWSRHFPSQQASLLFHCWIIAERLRLPAWHWRLIRVWPRLIWPDSAPPYPIGNSVPLLEVKCPPQLHAFAHLVLPVWKTLHFHPSPPSTYGYPTLPSRLLQAPSFMNLSLTPPSQNYWVAPLWPLVVLNFVCWSVLSLRQKYLEVRDCVAIIFASPTMPSTAPGTDIYGVKNISSPSCLTHI